MMEAGGHFKHLSENPTYIRPEDWRNVDELVDWIMERNEEGYQMVNSIKRLQEMKAFVRMSSGADLRRIGWFGDGTGTGEDLLATMPGIAQAEDGGLQFTDWNCGPARTTSSFAPTAPSPRAFRCTARPTTGARSRATNSNPGKSRK